MDREFLDQSIHHNSKKRAASKPFLLAVSKIVSLECFVQIVGCIVTAMLAYLLGSIPTGFLVANARGIDIRSVGSGNIGATNVFRALGKPAGIFVLVVDGLKGYAGCEWLPQLMLRYFSSYPADPEVLKIVGGLAAILGHNYTCWLKFKGGKGIATSAGVLAALVPLPLLIILAVWIVVFATTRYVSLGSLAASFSLPFAVWGTGGSLTLILVTAAMAVLAIYKHKANIERLLSGTESRFGSRKKEATL
jgi:glycerol-3-phosphate acyltransferase PlsY